MFYSGLQFIAFPNFIKYPIFRLFKVKILKIQFIQVIFPLYKSIRRDIYKLFVLCTRNLLEMRLVSGVSARGSRGESRCLNGLTTTPRCLAGDFACGGDSWIVQISGFML